MLGPGNLTCVGSGGPQSGEGYLVELGQTAARRPGRTEQARRASQHRQIGDGLTTVIQHDGEIDRDPARVVTALPLPHPLPTPD